MPNARFWRQCPVLAARPAGGRRKQSEVGMDMEMVATVVGAVTLVLLACTRVADALAALVKAFIPVVRAIGELVRAAREERREAVQEGSPDRLPPGEEPERGKR